MNEKDLLTNISDAEITEETCLIDSIPVITPEVYDWNTSLLSEICRDGDIYRLRLFIEYSRQTASCAQHATEIVDRLDIETGLSPLHHAARYQRLHLCLMLLSNIKFRSGVNIKDENDRTPIHSAFRSSCQIRNKNTDFQIENDLGNQIQDAESWKEEYSTKLFSTDHPLIYLFSKANGNLNTCDKYLLTPLHYACIQNNLSGVKQLIKLSANIESQDRQNIRPLHLACKEGYLSIVEYLIENNAQIDVMDADGWTPIHYACAKGHLDIIKFIDSEDKTRFFKILQMQTNTNATCLHLAVQNGNIQLVEYILMRFTPTKLKLLINQQAQPFGTPLHIAAKYSDPSMLDLLYYYGANPLILDSNEQSVLHLASASNRLAIVQQLYELTHTSLLEIKDNYGQTALSVTTSPEIIKQLIIYGADISSVDSNHMNVLMTAVLTNQTSIVKYLLSIINDQLSPILDQVEKQNNRSIFLIAVQIGSIDMCKLLLTHPSIRWNTIDKNHMNAFHIAAQYNHHKLIEFICNYIQKLNLNQNYLDEQNADGKTPLHFASEQGHRLSIEMLVKYGADVLLVNNCGQLPFHSALINGHSQCVDLLIQISKKNLNEFQTVLSRKQSPLITACRYGFVDIVKILLLENIGIEYDYNKEGNPLEIAINYRQIEVIHILLESSYIEDWFISRKISNKENYQTSLRDMIRYLPECAQHVFDRFILKTNEIDIFGEKFERIVYKYKYIDDYFKNDNKLYATTRQQLYYNHPLIIALDNGHYFLLEHPLIKQLMLHKWKLYRSLFYFPRILAFLLLIILTFYVLITPAPIPNLPSIKTTPSLPLQWIIIILSLLNLLKILLDILLFRGLHIPFAQLFGLISFLSSIIAFIPYENSSNNNTNIIYWQWQLTSFSILFHWFNIAIILRTVPFFGHSIVMIESVLMKFFLLLLMTFPLFIGFSISINMIFFNQSSFITMTKSLHKLSSMILGEFDYENLFYSKSTFTIATVIFITFVIIMTIVFINLLLGITIGDRENLIKKAQTKANTYWIRELIYIESILTRKIWLKSNLIEYEIVDHYIKNSFVDKPVEFQEQEILIDQPYEIELRKLLDILDMFCTQTKQVLDYEINLEIKLKKLLTIRKT